MTTPKALFHILLCAMAAGCASRNFTKDSEVVRVDKSSIRVEMDAKLPVPRAVVIQWVKRGGAAVTTYLGRFPVKHLTLRVHVSGGAADVGCRRMDAGGEEAVGGGVAYGSSSIDVSLGRNAQESDLNRDWVLTHEMFHLAFPTLEKRYVWMMEGLSDYLEPVARAQAAQWSASDAWLEFVQELPQGLPEAGEDGLDGSTRRERIYWGGSIYWLLADINIRVQTRNQHGLEDAIRSILNGGGNGGAAWPLQRVLAAGDQATGTTVLADLYQQLGQQRGDVDLDALWKKLGVGYSSGRIIFDDTAPWAKYRAAITGAQ